METAGRYFFKPAHIPGKNAQTSLTSAGHARSSVLEARPCRNDWGGRPWPWKNRRSSSPTPPWAANRRGKVPWPDILTISARTAFSERRPGRRRRARCRRSPSAGRWRRGASRRDSWTTCWRGACSTSASARPSACGISTSPSTASTGPAPPWGNPWPWGPCSLREASPGVWRP